MTYMVGADDHCNPNYKCMKTHTLILPILKFECTYNEQLRAVLYLLGLIYFFMGVAIVSDIFMSSIEMIVSSTRKVPVEVPDGDTKVILHVEVTRWNATVANLTLMALGSSAPEILLSVIEIVGNSFEAGELGPGTIVGSAAFNLLFITAVCVSWVPKGESRRINIYKVFLVTSTFSLFAYLWMLVVLDIVSPNEVEIWEAVVTLMCFPLLVIIAWWADNGFFLKARKQRESIVEKAIEMKKAKDTPADEAQASAEMAQLGMLGTDEHPLYVNGQVNPKALIEFYKQIRHYADVTDEEAASLIACKLVDAKEHSRLWYRIGACRGLMGGIKLQPLLTEKLQQVYAVINEHQRRATGIQGQLRIVATNPEIFRKKAVFDFQAAGFAVPEAIGYLTVVIVRSGRGDNEVRLRVVSIDGTAKAGADYEHIDEIVVFEPFVYERSVSVKIIDDNQWEPQESFFLRLSLVDPNQDTAMLGQTYAMEITILDDDNPGEVSFAKKGFLVSETSREVYLDVERENGCDGIVSVNWKTYPAENGMKHPRPEEGKLTFAHGERRKKLCITLAGVHSGQTNETFDVEMYSTEGGLKLGKIFRASVTISDSEHFEETATKVVAMAETEVEVVASGNMSYVDQIKGAFSVNGGNVDDATATDYILHFVTFFWKILFSLIPPPSIMGGWLCFVFALACIGVLTAIIGDLATIFGCLIGLEDTITAITFVALGTSLPDTFASMQAAIQDKTADNAIGNVTGSNSVNVFLGLGIPWTIAAIYHRIKGRKFVVESGALAFSVLVYSGVAVIALALLTLRRYTKLWGQAELGGPTNTKVLTSVVLILLWFVYVGLSTLQAYKVLHFDLQKIIN